MADIIADNTSATPNTQVLICRSCGRRFIFRRNEQEQFAKRGWEIPLNCIECNKETKEKKNKEREKLENQRWQQKKEEESAIFHERLKAWNVVLKDDIVMDNDQVLYILGNGFDLMHGVHSSYYAFRDSLRKSNNLRQILENFYISDDIWGDFEEALAHFNMEAMSGKFMVNNWLDIYDVYDKDAGAAEFFMAAEAAANPILTVCYELPRRFRMWIESLMIGTEDKPLRNMFRNGNNGKVLCFNYTEFVEELYGVAENHVCYIHGCRRKKKYHSKENLILGHMPGASDNSYNFKDDSLRSVRNPHKQYLIDAAQDQVIRIVTESDESLTKNCSEIILEHINFFKGLSGILNVIVIGHSLSPVDWDYFTEVVSRVDNLKGVHWFFGCHGLRDLENLEALLEKLDIPHTAVSVFQTDDITVTPIKNVHDTLVTKNGSNVKTRSKSSTDCKWISKIEGHSLKILNQKSGKTNYEVLVSSLISDAFFTPSGEYLFVIIRGSYSGILLFRLKDKQWCFIDELMQHQNLINPRLCHVFLTSQTITFVYNNRVRIYNLKDGKLTSNRGVQGARSHLYEGEDVSQFFFKR